MNYYLPRYDLPLVLGYTGPGLSFYGMELDGEQLAHVQKEFSIRCRQFIARQTNISQSLMYLAVNY